MLGVTSSEFCRDFQHQKTRVPRLSCGIVCMILRLAVSVEHRLVTGRKRRVFNPRRKCPLETEDERRCSGRLFQLTVPADLSGNAETSFVEFCCCSQRSQISTFNRTETGSAREIRRRYACWKCEGPASRIQLNARDAVLNCIRCGTGSQCRTSRSTCVMCWYLSPDEQRRSSPRVVA